MEMGMNTTKQTVQRSDAKAWAQLPIRGVNLGGWLVLEKWMTPSLFEGMDATDETTWCVEMGEHAAEKLHAHWNTFITREDFKWIARRGINTVRIPFGHWIFGPGYPYHAKYGANAHPFVEGGIEVLDRAMGWAAEFGLRVILDLHAAPGCQNGFDNGGIKDVCEWHTKREYLDHSLDVLERIALRYQSSPSLFAIEVLNEPRWDVPTSILKEYYRDAYHAIRAHCSLERIAVMFHDGFRSHEEFLGFPQAEKFENVIFDVHRYQCFAPEDINLDIFGHVGKAIHEWRHEFRAIMDDLGIPCVCGEWSLGMVLSEVSLWANGPWNSALDGMDPLRRTAALRAYGSAQMLAFEQGGWIFWSYKTESAHSWSFRDCVKRGWLPSEFR